jgi:hypothetical protein
MSEMLDKLLDELNKRKRSGRLPKRFRFKDPGDSIVGQIITIASNPFKQEALQYHVKSLKDGFEYMLPSNIALNRLLEEEKAKVGDYVLVRYVGTTPEPTAKGFFPKIYEVAVLPKEEAERIMGGTLKPAPAAPTVTEKPKLQPPSFSQTPVQPQQTLQPKPTTQVQPETTTQLSEQELKVREFVVNVMNFYGELSQEDLMKLVTQVRGYNITFERLLQIAPIKVEGDKVVLR